LWWEPVAQGTEGGLFWGGTEFLPGRVGKEYFMTHGHQHAVLDRAEFYGTVAGKGMLVLRDENGRIRRTRRCRPEVCITSQEKPRTA